MKIASTVMFKVKHPIFLAALSLNAITILLVLKYGLSAVWLLPPLAFYPFFGLFSSKENHNEVSTFYLSKTASKISLVYFILAVSLFLLSLNKLLLLSSVGLYGFYVFNLSEYMFRYFHSFDLRHRLFWFSYLVSILSSISILIVYILMEIMVDKLVVLALLNLGILSVSIVYFYLKSYYQMIDEKNIKQDFLYAKNVSILNANKLLEQKLLALDNEALNNQINPHFLFNAMNSINSLIILQKSEQAEIYINDLESFLNLILIKRNSSFYSLQEELKILTTYVKLESLRKNSQVKFTTAISSHIRPSDIYIPHLFLQSCLENSFWHGFVDISDPEIHIDITATPIRLKLVVLDNGIGISSALDSQNSSLDHRAAGMTILKNRLKTLEEHYQKHCEFKIEDRSENTPPERGTSVTITIPLILEPPLVRLLS